MKQLAPYDEFKAKAEKLKLTAETLTVTDINDRAGMQLARSTRLSLREIRVAVEHRRKELGEEALKTKQRIDADAKEMKDFCEAQESRLLEMEQFAERETARIQNEKRTARIAELTPFLSAPVAIDLGTMADEAYAGLLSDSKDAQAARIERERKLAEEAAAKLKAEAEERERIRLENEKLKAEAAEREAAAKKEREEAAAKLKAEQDRAAKEKAEAEEVARQERLRLQALAEVERQKAAAEAVRLKAESDARDKAALVEREAAAAKAKKEREAIEAKAKADREAREKLEAEVAAKKAAEDKAAAEKLAAEKAAAMAPTKDKLRKFAKDVCALALPLCADTNASYVKELSEGVARFAAWIEKKADAL